jgi:hypothetical protein
MGREVQGKKAERKYEGMGLKRPGQKEQGWTVSLEVKATEVNLADLVHVESAKTFSML